MYDNGHGVHRNYQKALEYYQKATDTKDNNLRSWAYNNLGEMYEHAKGVEKDYSQALQYYKQATEIGNATAYNNLADLYKYGKGTTKDEKMAQKYYEKACDMGYKKACNPTLWQQSLTNFLSEHWMKILLCLIVLGWIIGH